MCVFVCACVCVCVCVYACLFCAPWEQVTLSELRVLGFLPSFLPAQGDSGVARVDPGAPSHTAKVVLHDWSAESRCSLQDNLL